MTAWVTVHENELIDIPTQIDRKITILDFSAANFSIKKSDANVLELIESHQQLLDFGTRIVRRCQAQRAAAKGTALLAKVAGPCVRWQKAVWLLNSR